MTGLTILLSTCRRTDCPPLPRPSLSGETDDDGAGCRCPYGSLRPIFLHPVVIIATAAGLLAWGLIAALAIQHMRWS